MTTKTIRNRTHGHVTVRRTGRSVSLESFAEGTLAHQTCTTVAEAKALERATVATWTALA
jgi:hypothetical protein